MMFVMECLFCHEMFVMGCLLRDICDSGLS